MSSGMGEGLAFPSGFRGRSRNAVFPCLAPEDDAESRAPVVRLLLPAGYPCSDPPFRLPGRARWDIWREDQQAASGPARDAERYTFVIWDASDRYQSWLQRLIESEDARTDITVVLHESEDQVLRLLGSRPVLRLHCNRDMYECLFELVGVLVTPAMFQSIVGADPADFRHLSRFGGELRLFHACADQIETIVVRFTVFGKYADFPPSKVTGICLTVLVPLALPVVESIDALVLASHREGAVPDNVDVVLTAFAHRKACFP